MSVICPACKYDENPEGQEFCEACGAELPTTTSSPTIDPYPPLPDDPIVVPTPTPNEPIPKIDIEIPKPSPGTSIPSAKLIAINTNAPVQEFSLNRAIITIGKFDPDTGPVDINLDKFPDSDTISRKHAAIYREQDAWKIKDLGSTNGIFIRRTHQTDFSARITLPEIINHGDEIAIAQIFFRFETT
jgi:pSer/pThr/pTyr-binding forkhead associated (FHA) protein